MKLTIRPLCLGTMEGVEKSSFTYLQNYGKKIDAVTVMWYIDAKEKILVDTGPSDVEWALKYHHPLRRNRDETPHSALAKLGLKTDDIDIVICTHLHWDHSYNNDLFKNARIIVQQEEIRYAIAPHPIQGIYYESQLVGMKPPFLKTIEKYETIVGDKEISKGVSAIFLPGHTLGMQGVAVETRKGNYLIASDLVPLFENWDGAPPYQHHIPPGIHVDIRQCYESFQKVEQLASYVLPSHDVKIFDKTRYP